MQDQRSISAALEPALNRAPPCGVVRVQHAGRTTLFQVEGRVTMLHGTALRRLAEQRLDEAAAALRIDLRRCTYMDSTFLGTLLFLQRAIARSGQGALTLVSPSPQCLRLLRQMELEDLFHIEEADEAGEPAGGTWTELKGESEDLAAVRRTVAQVHQELARTPGAAAAAFGDVARGLACPAGPTAQGA